MKEKTYILLLLFSMMLTTGCYQYDDYIVVNDDPVSVSLSFAVSNGKQQNITRQPDVVVQDGSARAIEFQHIIPFAITSEKVTVNDMPKVFQVYGNGEQPVESRAYYYYDNCTLMSGVNAFLCYGRAQQASTNKHINGSLVETFSGEMAPKDTRFTLESIATSAHSTATALAGYMTAIASARGNNVAWKDAPSATLRVMYLNFVNQTEAEGGGESLPGSAANIYAYTEKLKSDLNSLTLTDPIDEAICTAITTAIANYNKAWDGFPASIGLPDGAAVIRWTGTAFEPQLHTTTLADINGINRYAYPAELYYYGNSRIYTSTVDKRKEQYTNRDWSAILADFEYAEGVVSSNTKAVAIKDPLQYGVAHVQIILKKTENTYLTDAAGTNVAVGTTSFPLTGILIGGQLPVGFDFTPTTAYPVYSEADMKFIYDNQLPTLYLSSTADATQVTNTLVLQSYDHKKVPVAFEFTNNSGVDFKGLGGSVLQGTKFYLVGEIDPEDFKDDERTEIRDRVFTQDYTTILNMKVTGLEKAYNVVPNLLSPRLEMGIELVPKWVATTPDEVLF